MRAFRHGNFRWFWFSSIGQTMAVGMQQLTVAWLVLELTGSASQLGIVIFLQGAPMLLFMTYGGVLTDRLNRVKLLLASQLLTMPMILAPGVLAASGHAHVWQVYISSLFIGTIQAVVFPARQAIVRDVVDREDMINAIALNSAVQNLTQIAGPSLAGFVIAWMGIALALYINASLYLIGIIGLLMIKGVHPAPRMASATVAKDITDGLKHIAGRSSVLALVLLGFATGFFVLPVAQIMPAFAREELELGADGAGLLLMFGALGAFMANSALAIIGDSVNRQWVLLWASVAHALALVAFAFVEWYEVALAVMLVVGAGRMLFVSLGTALVQLGVDQKYTGRALSIWYTGAALIFVGALPMGVLGDGLGLRLTIAGSALIYLIFVLWIGFLWPHIRKMETPVPEGAPVAQN